MTVLCDNCSPRKECFYYQNGETRTECKFYKPMTEQEHIQTCNTEQLAEFLYNIRYDYQVPWKNKGVVEWLKQPHTTKKE